MPEDSNDIVVIQNISKKLKMEEPKHEFSNVRKYQLIGC